jgi:two-component sensor histidine kinase
MNPEGTPSGIEELLDTPDLAGALESDLFKQFLDKLPVAIAVSKLAPVERVVYANLEFERLSGQGGVAVLGDRWDRFTGQAMPPHPPRSLAEAIAEEGDYLGAFTMPDRDGAAMVVDAWSNIIDDDSGKPAFRLVALVEAVSRDASVLDELEEQVREKDTQLKELQHRVRNNLQMITALIRMEARGVSDMSTGQGFDRLAGRVEALGLLYRALETSGPDGPVDLGVYLSEIASAVMRAHAVEGTHLDLQVDTWPVSLDIAMPVGLVVNELMINALKHAFQGRGAGTVTLHSAAEGQRCEIVVADDGVGLPADYSWPHPGKLSAMIVRSLLQNAQATLDVQSRPGEGMRVTIILSGSKPAPR